MNGGNVISPTQIRKGDYSMNKQELVTKIMEKTGAYKAVTERFINAFTEVVAETLAEGDKIQIVGFGTFEARERAAREARNPSTGAKIKVDACRVPAFKAGKALKNTVNK